MIRKLSLAMAVATALNPLNVYALGLGDIEVKSALNQALNAHIQLHSLAEGDLSAVEVKLASPAAFSKAGLERPFSLTQLQFKPEKDAAGKSVIKVSSRDPVREPFLNFLIEVNWSSGKLLREYTLLLDPPTTLMRRPPMVQQPRLKAPPARVKRATAKRSAAPVSMSGEKQVKVRRNDNLWNIAKRNQVAGVSTREMMQAIYDANPEAFYQADLNSLKSGVILRIPTDQQVEQQSTAQDRNEYISGVSAWESTTPMADSKAPKTRVETSPSVSSGKPQPARGEHLEILSAKPDEKGSAGDQAGKSGNVQVERLLKDLLLAKEATESSRMENTELQERVSSLQSQVSDLQRLITLKNNQLAKLQERAKDASEKKRLAEEKAASLAKQQDEKDKQLQALQAEKDQQIKTLEQEKEAEKERLAKQQVEREQKIKALEAEKQRQMKELQAAKAAEKEKLAKAQAEKEKQIKALQAEKSAEKARLAKEQAEKEAQIKALQAEKEAAEALAKLEREKTQKAAIVSKPKAKPEVKSQPKPKPEVKKQQQTAKPKPEAKPQSKPVTQSAPTKKVDPTEPPGLVDDLLANPLLLAGGGGGALLIGLLLWYRRRNQQMDSMDGGLPDLPVSELTDDDSIPAFEDSEPLGMRGTGGSPGEEESDSTSSFLTDFTPSELEQLGDETADVDPSSEADVYIAYGRYQQAQELMSEAVEREPERADLKVKYLEVLHASNAKSAFVETARQFKEAGMDQKDPTGWSKIVRMGRELAPENELFGDGGSSMISSNTSTSTARAPEPVVNDLSDDDGYSELSLTKLAEEIEGVSPSGDVDQETDNILSDLEVQTAQEVGGDGFDLQLDELESLEKEDVADSLGDITDELSMLGSPAPAQETSVEERKPAAGKEESSSLDFDLDGLDFTDINKGGDADIDEIFGSMPQDTSEENIDIQLGSINLDAEASEMVPDGLPGMGLESDNLELSPSSIEPGSAIEPKGFDVETDALDMPTEELDLDNLDGLSDLHTQPVDNDSFGLEGMGELPPTEQVDEVQTKLELAQAYQEMGDAEGARGILQEVAEEGNDDQKAEAKRILSEL